MYSSNGINVVFVRVRAYGPGIEPSGPVVGAPAIFTVETFSAGKGSVDVTVENPHGKLEPVSLPEVYLSKHNFNSIMLRATELYK